MTTTKGNKGPKQAPQGSEVPPGPDSTVKTGGGALRLEYVQAGSLTENPANWRTHGEGQMKALGELVHDPEIGWAGALLFNERTGRLIDGHARRRLVSPETLVPVLVGSWSEEAERKILLTLDPLGTLADSNAEQFARVLAQVEADMAGQQAVIASVLGSQGEGEDDPAKVEDFTPGAAPSVAWILLAIPVDRFAEAHGALAALESIATVKVEVCRNVQASGE